MKGFLFTLPPANFTSASDAIASYALPCRHAYRRYAPCTMCNVFACGARVGHVCIPIFKEIIHVVFLSPILFAVRAMNMAWILPYCYLFRHKIY